MQMVKYTILKKKQIEKIISQYPVGEVLDYSIVEGGAGNSSFNLKTTGGHYILTVCDEKTHNEVKILVDLLIYLKEKNFTTTRIVFSKNRKLITCFNGKSVILKKYIDGQVFRDLDQNMLFQLGKKIAHLHQIPDPRFLPKIFAYGIDSFSEIFSLPINQEYCNWLKEKKAIIIENLNSELPKGLIHGDIFHDNVLFTPQKKLAAIIDFEEACFYYKIFDLGMCIAGTCSPKGKISFDKAKSFIEGYQSERKREEIEKASLKLFSEYGAIATSFWRFRQHHIIKPNEDKTNSYLEMKNLAENIHSLMSEEFNTKIF